MLCTVCKSHKAVLRELCKIWFHNRPNAERRFALRRHRLSPVDAFVFNKDL